jgi:hypothetical protein
MCFSDNKTGKEEEEGTSIIRIGTAFSKGGQYSRNALETGITNRCNMIFSFNNSKNATWSSAKSTTPNFVIYSSGSKAEAKVETKRSDRAVHNRYTCFTSVV